MGHQERQRGCDPARLAAKATWLRRTLSAADFTRSICDGYTFVALTSPD
jgi:hypothetical protein